MIDNNNLTKRKKFVMNKKYMKKLDRIFQGEVFGEAVYSAAERCTYNVKRKQKWKALRDLETLTKTRVYDAILQKGENASEQFFFRLLGNAVGAIVAILPWSLTLKFLNFAISKTLKSFKRFEHKVTVEDLALAQDLSSHEQAQYEFVRRELSGEEDDSLEFVLKLLKP